MFVTDGRGGGGGGGGGAGGGAKNSRALYSKYIIFLNNAYIPSEVCISFSA